jgi:cytidine deaminase
MTIDVATLETLRERAKAAALRAYCPYSEFRVGAAILSRSGNIFIGCNVENASYGLTNCAERTAIFQMVAAGEKDFETMVIYAPTPEPTSPCGACRQVLHEFNPDAEVIGICDGPSVLRAKVRDLLPAAFGPGNLSGGKDTQ